MRQSTTSPPLTSAPSPFDKPSADTILRASDHVDFRVRRAILIEASPFFEDLFSLPQPQIDSLRIEPEPIAMPESSRVLNILLRLCYPLEDRIPSDLQLEDARAVLEAAVKYDIRTAIKPMCSSLRDFAQEQPLHVYAIACILRLESEARHAAQEAIKKNVVFGHYIEEFQELSAGCYYRLLLYQTLSPEERLDFDFVSPAPHSSPVDEPDATTSEPSHCQWRDMGPPFNRPDADVIVASKNQVRFRVHSMALKIISPVLTDMLTNPKSYPHQIFEDDAKSQDVPYYLALPEGDDVLKVLFGLLYYSNDAEITVEDHVLFPQVARSAFKYRIQGPLSQALKRHLLADADPLQSFLSAALYGWTDELKTLATRFLSEDAVKLRATYKPQLEEIDCAPYFDLLDYHRSCGQAAGTAINAYEPVKLPDGGCTSSYCYRRLRSAFLTAFRNYKAKMHANLVNKPHVPILSEIDIYREITRDMANNRRESCSECQRTYDITCQQLTEDFQSLKITIDQAISAVSRSCVNAFSGADRVRNLGPICTTYVTLHGPFMLEHTQNMYFVISDMYFSC